MEINITNLENYRIEKFFNRYSNHRREKFFSNFEFLTTFFPSLFNFLVFENYANLYERMYEFATKESGEFAALRLAALRLPPFPAAMASGAFVLDRAFRSISDICRADRRSL